jgi:aurora kinase
MHSSKQRTSHKEWKLTDFEIGRRLGRGKFGKVYVVREKQSGYICAMKVLVKADLLGHRVEKQVIREIEIHGRLRHKNCVCLYGWFHDQRHVYLLLEYAPGGELYGELSQKKTLDNKRAAQVLVQVVRGLIYLHQRGIAHRDIKPENVLVGFNGRVMLGDFGWASYIPYHETGVQRVRRTTLCGTLDYLPPEMVEARPHDEKSDVWAVGVLLYELLVGRPPFESGGPGETYRAIVRGEYTIPSSMHPLAVDLVGKLLVRKPSERILLTDVLVHGWVLKFNDEGSKK